MWEKGGETWETDLEREFLKSTLRVSVCTLNVNSE